MIALVFATRDLIVWIVMFIVSIVAGMFGFTFEFIC